MKWLKNAGGGAGFDCPGCWRGQSGCAWPASCDQSLGFTAAELSKVHSLTRNMIPSGGVGTWSEVELRRRRIFSAPVKPCTRKQSTSSDAHEPHSPELLVLASSVGVLRPRGS